jgi:hypothetical protein
VRPTYLAAALLAAAGTLATTARGEDPVRKTDPIGLAIGKKLPFHVADFVNGKHKGHGGCPGVMIANSAGRGVVIWSRGADESAARLAKALDGITADHEKFQQYWVVFDADEKVVAEKAAGLTRVDVGRARQTAKEEIDKRGVDVKVTVLVFFLDRKDIKAAWTFPAGGLTDDKVKELAAAAAKFAAGKD